MAKRFYTAYIYCRPWTAVRPIVVGCTTYRGRLYNRPWAAVDIGRKKELSLPHQKAYFGGRKD